MINFFREHLVGVNYVFFKTFAFFSGVFMWINPGFWLAVIIRKFKKNDPSVKDESVKENFKNHVQNGEFGPSSISSGSWTTVYIAGWLMNIYSLPFLIIGEKPFINKLFVIGLVGVAYLIYYFLVAKKDLDVKVFNSEIEKTKRNKMVFEAISGFALSIGIFLIIFFKLYI